MFLQSQRSCIDTQKRKLIFQSLLPCEQTSSHRQESQESQPEQSHVPVSHRGPTLSKPPPCFRSSFGLVLRLGWSVRPRNLPGFTSLDLACSLSILIVEWEQLENPENARSHQYRRLWRYTPFNSIQQQFVCR